MGQVGIFFAVEEQRVGIWRVLPLLFDLGGAWVLARPPRHLEVPPRRVRRIDLVDGWTEDDAGWWTHASGAVVRPGLIPGEYRIRRPDRVSFEEVLTRGPWASRWLALGCPIGELVDAHGMARVE